jgi:hypothetical protein
VSATASLLVDTLQIGAARPTLADEWRSADVRGLIELIRYERASVWMWQRLHATGAIDAVSDSFRADLRATALENAAARLNVEAETAAVLERLDAAGVGALLTKGSARSALARRYPLLDARATQDVDLLVSGVDIDRATDCLRAAGYHEIAGANRMPDCHHHRQPLIRDGVLVELHTSTSPRVAAQVAWARNTEHAESVEWAGRDVRVPSPTELAWNSIAHALEDGLAGFRVARFLELAALVGGGAPIDWRLIAKRTRLPEMADPAVIPRRPDRVARRWIAAALSLVDANLRPPEAPVEPFDLVTLLAWRARVMRASTVLGRSATDRMLEEGGRSLAGMPLQPLTHAGASRYSRSRRMVAAGASRVAHRLWRATRMH